MTLFKLLPQKFGLGYAGRSRPRPCEIHEPRAFVRCVLSAEAVDLSAGWIGLLKELATSPLLLFFLTKKWKLLERGKCFVICHVR